MLKNILFLIACVFITVAAWLVFQVFGQHTFLIMLGPAYLSRLNLQQCVWYLGKAEPM